MSPYIINTKIDIQIFEVAEGTLQMGQLSVWFVKMDKSSRQLQPSARFSFDSQLINMGRHRKKTAKQKICGRVQ